MEPDYFKSWLKYLADIRFWIILFFIVRLYGITQPPLEGPSTWRQCDGLMIARNFYEVDSNILFPRVDLAGEKTGITGSEFPILNYFIYIISLVFGFQDWYGRLINLLLSSIATWYFYKILRSKFNNKVAFNSSMILMISMWFTYSRITIPDIFGASLCIIAVYYAFDYLERGKVLSGAIFIFLALIGCLAKVSSASILTVLLLPVLNPENLIRRKLIFSACSSFILVIVCLWYFYWVPFLNDTYGFDSHFFMGQTFQAGLNQHIQNWELSAKRFYETPLKYSGFIIFFVGLIVFISRREMKILLAFAIPYVSFFLIAIVAGWGFYVNSYYPIMFVPPMAFIVGALLSTMKNKWSLTLMLIISIEGILNQYHSFTVSNKMKPYLELEGILNQSGIKQNDLVAVNSNSKHDPTPMYFLHRKGWGMTNTDLSDPQIISTLKARGCKFVIMLNIDQLDKIEIPYKKVHESDIMTIYSIQDEQI